MKEKSNFKLVLGIDTAEIGRFQLYLYNNGQVLSKKYNQSAESLGFKIQKFLSLRGLKIEDIETMVVNRGPGSFTGLRIGLVWVNAFAWFFKKPIFATMKKLSEKVFEGLIDSLNKEKICLTNRIQPFYGSKFRPIAKASRYQKQRS